MENYQRLKSPKRAIKIKSKCLILNPTHMKKILMIMYKKLKDNVQEISLKTKEWIKP